MDLTKLFLKRAAVWLILGLLGAGVAADLWWRQRQASELAELKTRHADQLHEAETKINRLTEELRAERQRREALERVLSEGRK